MKRFIERLCLFLQFSNHNFTSVNEARRFSLERSFINFPLNNIPYPYSSYVFNSTKGQLTSSFSIHSQMVFGMSLLSLNAKRYFGMPLCRKRLNNSSITFCALIWCAARQRKYSCVCSSMTENIQISCPCFAIIFIKW